MKRDFGTSYRTDPPRTPIPPNCHWFFELANQIAPVSQCSDFDQHGLPMAPSLPFAKWRRGLGRALIKTYKVKGRRLSCWFVGSNGGWQAGRLEIPTVLRLFPVCPGGRASYKAPARCTPACRSEKNLASVWARRKITHIPHAAPRHKIKW